MLSVFVDSIGVAAVRMIVLACAIGLVLRVLRIDSPRIAHRAWSLTAVAMLLLPCLAAVGPTIALPILPAPQARVSVVTRDTDAERVAAGSHASDTVIGAPSTLSSWRPAAATVYVVGVGAFLVQFFIGVGRAMAIQRGASTQQGRLTHPACVTPMTIGFFAPTIILPSDWGSWDRAELAAILAHEREHVRWRDPLVSALTLLNRALFWFHPVAWWLHREVARLAEEACDAAVMVGGHDADLYTRSLLRFARRAADARGRVAVGVMAMPGTSLRKRIDRLTRARPSPASWIRLTCTIAVCAAVTVVGAVAAPTPAQPDLVSDRSEHFEVRYEISSLPRVDETVRLAEAVYAQVSSALRHDLANSIPLVLVATDREVRGTSAPGGVVVSLASVDDRERQLVQALTRIFAIDIMPEVGARQPQVIDGLVDYEGRSWDQEGVEALRTAMTRNAVPTLGDLAEGGRHWSHALFDYAATRHGDDGLRRLLFALRARGSVEAAVPFAFGSTAAQFDQQFQSFLTARFGNR